jgi:hypothetical protein
MSDRETPGAGLLSLDVSLWLLAACLATTGPSTGRAQSVPAPRSLSLKPVAFMSEHRASHTATLLTDGRVLIAGGFTTDQNGREQEYLRSAEVFDPRTGKFSLTGEMTYSRAGHRAALLRNGLVLVVGGFGAMGVLSSAELFDPVAETFIPIGNMAARRGGFTATLLIDGRVLICGGGDREVGATAEIYDPASKRFAATGNMTIPRTAHSATWLPGGMVLITGGSTRRNVVLASAEIYDPAAGRFLATGSMAFARYKHAAAPMNDGDVLIVGGADERDWRGPLATVERYELATGRFVRLADIRKPRFRFPDAMVGFEDGSFLLAGGSASLERLTSPGGESTVVGELDKSYAYSTATALRDGTVLIAGGYDEKMQSTNKAWIWKNPCEHGFRSSVRRLLGMVRQQ